MMKINLLLPFPAEENLIISSSLMILSSDSCTATLICYHVCCIWFLQQPNLLLRLSFLRNDVQDISVSHCFVSAKNEQIMETRWSRDRDAPSGVLKGHHFNFIDLIIEKMRSRLMDTLCPFQLTSSRTKIRERGYRFAVHICDTRVVYVVVPKLDNLSVRHVVG